MPKVSYTNKKGLVQESGSGIELNGSTMSGALRSVRSVVTADSAAGITLGSSDSGMIISILSSVGAVAVALPAAATAGSGWYCDICYAADTPGGDVTFTGGTFKVIEVDGGAASETPTSGITLTAATASSTAGDRARVFCDGTLYYVMAASSAGGIFASA